MKRKKEKINSLEKYKKREKAKSLKMQKIFLNSKKEIDDNIIKIIRNLFKLKKENEVIKDGIIRNN